jgi:hypothetical protein
LLELLFGSQTAVSVAAELLFQLLLESYCWSRFSVASRLYQNLYQVLQQLQLLLKKILSIDLIIII